MFIIADREWGNFTLHELIHSETAQRLSIDNTPSSLAVGRLEQLVSQVLQPVRDHFQSPVTVRSGYRSEAVNKAVGGSPTSQHMLGEAADIKVVGVADYDVANYIAASLVYDQMILEYPPNGWVHVSFSDDNKREMLTKLRHKPYIPGLLPPDSWS